MKNPSRVKTKTVGEAEVSEARKKAMLAILKDYPKVLGSYAGHFKFDFDGEEITDQNELFIEQKWVMDVSFGAFINRLFVSRVAYELSEKAAWHLKQFQFDIVRRMDLHLLTPKTKRYAVQSIPANTQAIIVYEDTIGRDILMMLAIEKEDPKADEVLFWSDFRSVLITLMPAMEDTLNKIWEPTALEWAFQKIEKGIKYQ